MRKVVLTGIREMEMIEVPDPVLTDETSVLLRVGVVGVCGSDVHYYTTGRIGVQVVEYPFAVGHECSAIVEAVGAAVTRVKPGDHVAVEPADSCGTCDQCLAGRPHTCRDMTFLGCPGQVEGCLSDLLVMDEACCFPLDQGTSLERAALVEPLSIGLYGVKLSVPMPGARIGILGCGPIGLSVLLPARQQGAGKIYMTDRIDERLSVARQAGADWAGNPDTQDVVGEIVAQEPLLLDVVFECCGEQEAVDQAVELLKPGGKLIMIGIPEVERISFVIDKCRRKEICIQNVRRQNECVQPALDLIEGGSIPVDFMVTHHFSLEQTREAFDLVAGYEDGVVKAMIHVGGEDR